MRGLGITLLVVGLLGIGMYLAVWIAVTTGGGTMEPSYAYGAGMGLAALTPVLVVGIILSFIGVLLIAQARTRGPPTDDPSD